MAIKTAIFLAKIPFRQTSATKRAHFLAVYDIQGISRPEAHIQILKMDRI